MTRSTATSLALALLAVVTVATPAAADVTCTGTIADRTILDDVVVPAGATCTLARTSVDGNVLVGPGASVTILSASIDGNVQDDDGRAGAVRIRDTAVGGDIQLEQGASVTVLRTSIGGDMQLEANSGQLQVTDATIGGNLQANRNTGGLRITGNTIDGNLQCQSNAPTPVGGNNVVRGSAEGQCSDLSGEGSAWRRFRDVPDGHVHAEGIAWLAASGITGGCTADGRDFCPERPVTRAQMATLLYVALGLPQGDANRFDDVGSGHLHANGIGAIARAGVTDGCDADGTRYCPAATVTRAQMATFLARALDLPDGPVDRFGDVGSNHAHATGIGAIARAGITSGCNRDGRLYCPAGTVTRGQMATFLMAALRERV